MEVMVNGVKTYAATGGKEFDSGLPTVLFLNGSGLDHRCWALQTRWFAFHGFSVLAPDFPGHSLSEGEPLNTIEESGQWLADFLEASGAKAAHVVGHSQGFLSALELAHQAPDCCASLTGIATAAAIPVNPVLIETAEANAAEAADIMLQWGFGSGAQYGISATPGMQPIAIGRQIMSRNPLAIDLAACAAYTRGAEVAAELGDIPMHLILAGRDRMTPVKAGLELAKIRQTTSEVLREFGHMLPMEAPKQTLQALRSALTDYQLRG